MNVTLIGLCVILTVAATWCPAAELNPAPNTWVKLPAGKVIANREFYAQPLCVLSAASRLFERGRAWPAE